MYTPKVIFLLIIGLLCGSSAQAQNETSQWYFGGFAGLNHLTSPPTAITNTNLSTGEGMASMADASGGLLFYTDGSTIYNKQQVVMANGTGLKGSFSSTQSALIVKQPGNNNLYYVFSIFQKLHYSVVDMNLAAGIGSVTVKNVLLDTNVAEKLTGTLHCNNLDSWIVVRQDTAADFHSYLLTSAGINTVPVISPYPNKGYNYWQGYMKISPNGNKIASQGLKVGANPGNMILELCDFDNSTGIVSNPLALFSGSISNPCYGIEFSKRGTKLYACTQGGTSKLYQWDLCAGNNAMIAASMYSASSISTISLWAMQLAPDGKIYCANNNMSYPSLSVILDPDQKGAACGFVPGGQAIGSGTCQLGLPNFVSSYFRVPVVSPPVSAQVSSSVSCSTYTFAADSTFSFSYSACAASNYYVNNMIWNFGDPGSGAANSSNQSTAVHVFSGPGTYSVQALIYYKCRVDTIRKVVTIPSPLPTVSVSGNFNICPGSSAIITATGADTYSWTGNLTGNKVTLNPTVSTLYHVVGTNTANGCANSKFFTVSILKCTSVNEVKAELGTIYIYPSPVKDKLNLNDPTENTPSDCNRHILIYAMNGQKLKEFIVQFKDGNASIDVSDLPGGLYFIVAEANAGYRAAAKFVVNR